MEFMIDAYRSNQLSEDPDGDVSKLIEKFDGRMSELQIPTFSFFFFSFIY
jgi:hypothetical protein